MFSLGKRQEMFSLHGWETNCHSELFQMKERLNFNDNIDLRLSEFYQNNCAQRLIVYQNREILRQMMQQKHKFDSTAIK